MAFIVCGNSCCLNYAKFTPTAAKRGLEQTTSSWTWPDFPPENFIISHPENPSKATATFTPSLSSFAAVAVTLPAIFGYF